MMKQYKALFIDWDDTIGDFIGAAQKALFEMYEKYQLSDYFASTEEFVSLYKPHNLELWEKYGKDQVTKDYLSFDRFFYPLMHGSKLAERREARGEKQKTRGEMLEIAALAEQLSEDFLNMTTANFSLLPGAEQAIKKLAQKYTLVILSNGFIEVQYQKIERSGLAPYFQHVVLSEEVGYQKPNPLIYQAALDKCGLQASEVLMIGDSWYSDIQGAIQAGIDQMWIKRGETTEEDLSAVTYIVRNLEEAAERL